MGTGASSPASSPAPSSSANPALTVPTTLDQLMVLSKSKEPARSGVGSVDTSAYPFAVVMESMSGRKLFMLHLESEFSAENLLFFNAVDEFRAVTDLAVSQIIVFPHIPSLLLELIPPLHAIVTDYLCPRAAVRSLGQSIMNRFISHDAHFQVPASAMVLSASFESWKSWSVDTAAADVIAISRSPKLLPIQTRGDLTIEDFNWLNRNRTPPTPFDAHVRDLEVLLLRDSFHRFRDSVAFRRWALSRPTLGDYQNRFRFDSVHIRRLAD